MNIKHFECNMLQENCYVLSDETLDAVIIDCGAMHKDEHEAISRYIDTAGLHPVQLLCTHGHFDHVFGNSYIFDRYGLKPRVHQADSELLSHVDQQCLQMMGHTLDARNVAMGDALVDGETVTFGTHTLQVIHTPGHTRGGVVLWCKEEGIAFSGDTLFRMSIGRTDLPGGNYEQMAQSLHRLVALLPADTLVYPGHGPSTTMSDELRMNPYLHS